MKAVVIYEPGEPEKLICTEVPTPKVKDGWSLIKVIGFGVNHSEIFTRQGFSPSVAFPRILGIECAGIVAESTDARLARGSRVVSIMGEMGRAFDGSYAEYVLIPNEQIYPVETGLPWEILAAIPETYYTAWGSLRNLKIVATDEVLVRGATSGVGVAFVRLLRAKYADMRIDGSSRSAKKEKLLREAGFSGCVIDENGKLQTERKYDKILELIGPATTKDSFRHLKKGGIVCSTGQLGGQWALADFEPIGDMAEDSYLTSFYSGNVYANRLNEMLSYIKEYHVDAKPERVYRLDELPEAHAYLEASRSFGKVVVLTGQDDAK